MILIYGMLRETAGLMGPAAGFQAGGGQSWAVCPEWSFMEQSGAGRGRRLGLEAGRPVSKPGAVQAKARATKPE